jgi:hypothetical protein
METKHAIIILGKPNAGKSTTWYKLFGRVIRSGWKKLNFQNNDIPVLVKNSSPEESEIEIDVFVRNASFEEYGDEIEDYFNGWEQLPKIIFCSVQYTEHGKETIDWFVQNNYKIYIQWLNQGYRDSKPYEDYLNFESEYKNKSHFVKFVSTNDNRIENIKQYFLNNIINSLSN